MRVKVLEYRYPPNHDLVCEIIGNPNSRIFVDPYVGCAISHNVTIELVGRVFDMSNCTYVTSGTYCPSEGDFVEVTTQQTFTPPLNITIVEGCTAYAQIFNGIPEESLTDEQKSEIVDYLIAKLKERVQRGNTSLESIVQLFEYDSCKTDDEACDQCGDYVTTTKYIID
jgi:hypothetical protein